MVDSPTSRNRIRKQETGTNVNTWGDLLDEALDVIDQLLDGVESINLGAATSYTLTTTNYTTADEAKQRVLQFTNAAAAGCDVIIPSVEHEYGIYNNSGADLEVRTAAGTGPTIPTGYYCQVYSDGSNVYSRPLFVNGAIRATAAGSNGELTTLLQVSNLIAAQLTTGDGSFLVSADDTTRKFLEAAAAAGTGIALTVLNPGANEQLQIAISLTEGTGVDISGATISVDTTELEEFLALTGKITATLSAGTTAMTARRRYRISSTATGTLPTMAAGDFVIVEFTNGAGITATVGRNSQTIDGASADDTYIGDGAQGPVVRYDYASAGVVTSRLIEGIPA